MIITNELGLPAQIYNSCKQEYTYRPKRYSVTTILKDPKQVLLQRRHANEIVMDCADMIYLISGTAFHSYLEKQEGLPTELKEESIEYHTRNGYTMSGRFDKYDIVSGLITEWKEGSVNKVLYNNVDDYIKQGKYYCVALRQMGFPASKFEIVMKMRDWVAYKAKYDPTYPKHGFHIWKFEFTEKELNEAEEEINLYFEELERLEKLEDDFIPACSKEKRTFNSEDKYAVMKFGRKRALKVCDTEEQAKAYLNEKGGDYIELRPATDKNCIEYCTCSGFCNYYKQLMEEIKNKEGEEDE